MILQRHTPEIAPNSRYKVDPRSGGLSTRRATNIEGLSPKIIELIGKILEN